MAILTITKDNFEELVLQNTRSVLLDFWAPWCGPCRMVAPILEELDADREDLDIGKIDVDTQMELAMQFGVASIPTLVVMREGKAVSKAVGYMPREQIEALLK